MAGTRRSRERRITLRCQRSDPNQSVRGEFSVYGEQGDFCLNRGSDSRGIRSPRGSTMVHAGFGRFIALLDNLDYRLDQTAPYNTTQTLKNVPISRMQVIPGSTARRQARISPSGVQPDAYTPTLLSWKLKVDQQVAPRTAFRVGYVGSHGYHEMLSLDANEPVPTSLPAGLAYHGRGSRLRIQRWPIRLHGCQRA